MHEYDLLYYRWKRYILKKRLLIVTIGAVIGGSVYGVYYAYTHFAKVDTNQSGVVSRDQSHVTLTPKSSSGHNKKGDTKKSNATLHTPSQPVSSLSQNHKEKEKEIKTQKESSKEYQPKVITPLMSFEKRLSAKEFVPPAPKPVVLHDKELIKKEQKRSYEFEVDESERRYGRAKLLFKEETDGGIKALESKFYHSPSLATALQIARYYYNKGDYKNAIKWAMRANSLDKRNEESWLLFAKALAKSGKRGRAISVLEIYAKQSGSHEALRLIEKIRAGVVE